MKKNLFWQVIVLVLGLILVLSIRTYLLDKNEITAEKAYSDCKVKASENSAPVPCEDIKHYKLKFSGGEGY